MARKEIVIQNFSGGIADDIRQQTASGFAISQHFDIFTSANRITPYRDWVSNDTGHIGVLNFLWDGTTLYGLGVKVSGGLKAQIYKKTTMTGDWSDATTATSATGGINVPGQTFVLYKGFIYHWILTNILNRYEIASNTYTDSYKVLSTTNIAQGLVHSKTDQLFLPYNNILARMNNTTWTDAALTLPSNCVITALCEYGNYLAIATRPTASGVTTSKVFLWDMVKSDVSEVIDFGAGDLFVIGTVNGRLVGVMNEALSGANALPFAGVTFSPQKVFIKTYSGAYPTIFKTLADTGILCGYTLGSLSTGRSFIQSNNGLSFVITSSGSLFPTGIYTISTIGENYGMAVTCERNIFNSTAITGDIGGVTVPGVQGIAKVGNMWFVSYNPTWSGGSGDLNNATAKVGRTDATANYTGTAYMETIKYNMGDVNQAKKLVGVAFSMVGLPSGATVTLKYKVDAETSYTTISTKTTTNAVVKESVNIESTGKNLPEFYEIQFRIESTGGGEVKGFKFMADEAPSNLLKMK